MPPLTTPATAVLFMIAFFVVMMGVPLLTLWVGHHRSPHVAVLGPRSHRAHKLILSE